MHDDPHVRPTMRCKNDKTRNMLAMDTGYNANA